jgi:hypothetical protein
LTVDGLRYLKNIQNEIALRLTLYALRIERISLGCHDISFNIHPESQNEINDQRRSHSEKRNINKPGSYAGRSDAQTFSDSSTNTEDLPFNEFLHPVHMQI